MACYFGCRGCCAKIRWFIFVLAALIAVACLVAGLIRTIPPLIELAKCSTAINTQTSLGSWSGCFPAFWHATGVYFILSLIGVAALLFALITCCCFVCSKSPKAKERERAKREQFAQGDVGGDTQGQVDQYGYPVQTTAPKGPANV